MKGYKILKILTLIDIIFKIFLKKVGQVDFYPNGGMAPQPGCENEDPLGIDCSHARAPVSIFHLLKQFKKKNAVALKQM